MATKAKAAKREAGKSSAKKNNVNSRITAEIGKVYLSLVKENGECSIEFSTDCVDPNLNTLWDFVSDNHGAVLEDPGRMFGDCTGWVTTEVEPKVLDAVRKWIAKNTDWRFFKG